MRIYRLFLLITLTPLICLSLGCSRLDDDSLKASRELNADADLESFIADAPNLKNPIDLEQAVRLSHKHNLNHLMELQALEIKKEMVSGAKLKMLPRFNVNLVESQSSENSISSLRSSESGTEVLSDVYNTEKRTSTREVSVL